MTVLRTAWTGPVSATLQKLAGLIKDDLDAGLDLERQRRALMPHVREVRHQATATEDQALRRYLRDLRFPVEDHEGWDDLLVADPAWSICKGMLIMLAAAVRPMPEIDEADLQDALGALQDWPEPELRRLRDGDPLGQALPPGAVHPEIRHQLMQEWGWLSSQDLTTQRSRLLDSRSGEHTRTQDGLELLLEQLAVDDDLLYLHI